MTIFLEQFLKYTIYSLNLYDHTIVNISSKITQSCQFKLEIHINIENKDFYTF